MQPFGLVVTLELSSQKANTLRTALDTHCDVADHLWLDFSLDLSLLVGRGNDSACWEICLEHSVTLWIKSDIGHDSVCLRELMAIIQNIQTESRQDRSIGLSLLFN